MLVSHFNSSAGINSICSGQLMLFEEVKTGIMFIVANTHILFNMNRGDLKTGQIAYLLASIDKLESGLASKEKYAGVLMCGDFNIEPNSPLYYFIRNGQLYYAMHHYNRLAFNSSTHPAKTTQQQGNNQYQLFKLEKNVLLDHQTCKFVETITSGNALKTLFIKGFSFFRKTYRHVFTSSALSFCLPTSYR